MQENDPINALNLLIEKGLNFACWSLPGQHDWECVVQKDKQKHFFSNLSKSGFVIAPFNSDSGYRIIINDIHFSSAKSIDLDEIKPLKEKTEKAKEPHIDNYDSYIRNCEYLISLLQKGILKKVVLSRVARKELNTTPSNLFNTLRISYKNSMVFLYQLDGHLWIGATPETFIKADSKGIETMALAGSKAADSTIEWTYKEIEEHAYVERYIESIFKQEGLTVHKKGPQSIVAGPVEHLQSIYTAVNPIDKIFGLIRKIHPTPAVCGIPLQEAREAISKVEKHNRMDYTGFMGPVSEDSIKLFVNLRSGQIIGDNLYLYLGGGITKDSNSEKEWKETELKAQTLLSIL